MSEKDKGFSFKRLFFRDVEETIQEPEIKKEEPQVKNDGGDFISNYSAKPSVSTVHDQILVEDFVKRLQNLINQNNQVGFDFLEFTESLFEEKHNPGPEVYKTVFRIAQRIDKTLTPARLLDSALSYKNLVENTAESEIGKGETKKGGLLAEKETERNNLDNNLKDTKNRIQQLMKQIQELQNMEVDLNSQLMLIDNKYDSKISDIDNKINAIRSAKDQVIVSIVDIEAGIKTNLT